MCVIKDFEIGKKSGTKKKKQFNETKKQPEQLSTDMDVETMLNTMISMASEIVSNPAAKIIEEYEKQNQLNFLKRNESHLLNMPKKIEDRMVYLLGILKELSQAMFQSETEDERMDAFYDFEDFYHPYLDETWSDYMDMHVDIDSGYNCKFESIRDYNVLKQQFESCIDKIIATFPDDNRFKQQTILNGLWELCELERNVRDMFFVPAK